MLTTTMLPICHPLPVIGKRRPFDGAEWIFELKYDGFRALAYLEHGRCRVVSRNGHVQRKLGLRKFLNSGVRSAAIYADHVEAEGTAFYSRVCDIDLKGIVAKHKDAPYLSETTISTWYKIRNPQYSQMDGRHELF